MRLLAIAVCLIVLGCQSPQAIPQGQASTEWFDYKGEPARLGAEASAPKIVTLVGDQEIHSPLAEFCQGERCYQKKDLSVSQGKGRFDDVIGVALSSRVRKISIAYAREDADVPADFLGDGALDADYFEVPLDLDPGIYQFSMLIEYEGGSATYRFDLQVS